MLRKDWRKNIQIDILGIAFLLWSALRRIGGVFK